MQPDNMTPPPIPPVTDAVPGAIVQYSLTRWDILRWHFYLLIRNRAVIAFVAIASLGMVWNDLRTLEMAERPIGFKVLYAVFFTGAMFCLIGIVTTLVMSCAVMFKRLRGLLGRHELEIRDDGLVERTEFNESVHRWRGFHKIVTTGRYLYIFVTDNSVHIVPRRHFASEEGVGAFRDEIKRHISAAS